MGVKFIATRAHGFRWTMGGEQWEFPCNTPVEVPDELVAECDDLTPFLTRFASKVELKKRAAKAKAKSTDGTPLATLEVQPAILEPLTKQGIETVEAAKKFFAKHGTFQPLLGGAANAELIKALGPVEAG